MLAPLRIGPSVGPRGLSEIRMPYRPPVRPRDKTSFQDTLPTESSAPAHTRPSDADIDLLLTAQIAVAWAGERGEEARLGWWDTDMMSEFGGEDLFKRLLPHSWDWAVVQAIREAARRHDAHLRAKVHDPDTVVSLYRLGLTIDERADERLMQLKRRRVGPDYALPDIGKLVAESWRREAFQAWVQKHGDGKFQAAPAGRQLPGSPPDSLKQTVNQLVAALHPLGERYPLPHFRRAR